LINLFSSSFSYSFTLFYILSEGGAVSFLVVSFFGFFEGWTEVGGIKLSGEARIAIVFFFIIFLGLFISFSYPFDDSLILESLLFISNLN
jgi:hypothetical protein